MLIIRSNKILSFLLFSQLEKIAIFLAFILPPLILAFITVTNIASYWIIGGLTTVTVATYLVITKTPITTLGFKLKWKSVLSILPGTLSIAIVQLLLLAIFPWLWGRFRPLYLDIDYIWYFYITLFQEIIWRGFAFLLLEKLYPSQNKKSIIVSAILFAFMHIYFKSILIIVGSFLLGIYWGRNYVKYRSILGVSISHYFLGLVCIILNYMGIRTSWSWL